LFVHIASTGKGIKLRAAEIFIAVSFCLEVKTGFYGLISPVNIDSFNRWCHNGSIVEYNKGGDAVG